MKLPRLIRVAGIAAFLFVYLYGKCYRAHVIDSGLAAYHQALADKRPVVSVSIEEEGRKIKVEGVQKPGQTSKPCSATLVFDAAP